MPVRGAATSHRLPTSPFARLWMTSHAPEYLGLLLLLVGWICILLFVTPFHRMFSIDDLNISYPFAEHERVPVAMLFVYALFIPLAILIASNLATRSPAPKHEATYLSFAVAVLLTLFLTDIIKNAVGRPRPDLLDRCRPRPDTATHALVTVDVCSSSSSSSSGNGHRLHEGWRSFPSGHSSFSFAGLGFLSLFLAGQLHLFRAAVGGRDLARALVCLAPLLVAALIAISRCEDYRHDVYDVCVGSVLGFSVAYWSYRRHWPALTSPFCAQPYPPPGADGQIWQRLEDEELGAANSSYRMSQLPSNGRS